MRCPECRHHVTPFVVWVRQFTDAPGECFHCGTRLLPSRRPIAWLPVALLAAGVMLPAAVVVGVQLDEAAGINHLNWWNNQPLVQAITKITMFLTIVPAVYGTFYLGWRTGWYRIDTSEPIAAEAAYQVTEDEKLNGPRAQTVPAAGGKKVCGRCHKIVGGYAVRCKHCKAVFVT